MYAGNGPVDATLIQAPLPPQMIDEDTPPPAC
jgi:hypothetical protein